MCRSTSFKRASSRKIASLCYEQCFHGSLSVGSVYINQLESRSCSFIDLAVGLLVEKPWVCLLKFIDLP